MPLLGSLGTKLAPSTYCGGRMLGSLSRREGGRHCQYSLVSIGNSNPSHRASVAAQEEEGDIASGGHQVDEHGHPNGPQGRQAELLHQKTAQEDTQTSTRDCSHPWKTEGQGCEQGRRGQSTDGRVEGLRLSPVNAQ